MTDLLQPRHPAPFDVAVSWLGASRFEVPKGGVRLVLAVPDAERDGPEVAPILSIFELTRREAIQHPRALAEFTTGRLMMRTALGALLGVAPEAVPILETERGALVLDGASGSRLRFNLSHTDGLAVLAIAESDVGVDVEWLERPGRTVELAERYFAPSEVNALRALPREAQRDRFFDLWTLKESYIKARGLGLAIPLASFAFAGFESPPLTLTVAPEQRDRPDDAWRFGTWQLGPRHRLALTFAG